MEEGWKDGWFGVSFQEDWFGLGTYTIIRGFFPIIQ
jgi:hypothetical protein